MRIFLLAVSLLLASWLGAGHAYADGRTYHQLTSQQRSAVEDSLRRSLIDPTSAIFGEFRAIVDDARLVVVCGYVNGKNNLGGYVGAKPFRGLFSGDRFDVINFGGSDKDARETEQRCSSAGIDVRTLAPIRADFGGSAGAASTQDWRSMFAAHPVSVSALVVLAAIGAAHLLMLLLGMLFGKADFIERAKRGAK